MDLCQIRSHFGSRFGSGNSAILLRALLQLVEVGLAGHCCFQISILRECTSAKNQFLHCPGSDGSDVGLLLTALGVGGLIGSLSIANLRKGHRRGWILLGGAFIAGGSLALIVGVPYFAAGMIGMIGLGLGEQARWALGQSLMMENAAEEYRARVMSVLMMTFGLMPLGTAPMGFAMDALGGRFAVGIYGVVLIAFAVYSVMFMPRLRRLK